MTITDKRQHPRIDSLNLISYVCIDETDTDVIQGMGRTLNVSEGGILLETHIQIDPKHTLSLTIGLEEDLVDIKGEVAHSKPGEDDNFEQPTAERLAGLGPGCFVQIQRNGRCDWIEITRTEGDEFVGTMHPMLSTPLPANTSENSTSADGQTINKEVRLRKEQITALGCDRYCVC